MPASQITVLFAEPPEPSRREPSAMMVSILAHGLACILVFLISSQPRHTRPAPVPHRYEVRIMELQPVKPIQFPAQQKTIAAAGQPAPTHSQADAGSTGQAAAPQIPADLTAFKRAAVTILQPDAPDNQTIAQETPVPQIMVWSARNIAVKKIVTVPQQVQTTIAVIPSVAPPNLAQRVADIRISPNTTAANTPLPAPSTTSPVKVVAATATIASRIPETALRPSMQVVPTSVISLSDVQLKEGTIAVPPVNEVSPTFTTGSLTPGQPNGKATAGQGSANNKLNGSGSGTTTGKGAGNGAGNSNSTLAGISGPGGNGGNGSGGVGGAKGASGAGGGISPDAGGGFTITHVTLPREGKFGVVVVGSSISDDYPETVGIWSGRLAYTVYLHVGAAKSWILQYSLPRAKDAATAGTVVKLDAPWPYDVMRPSIDPDLNSDAIMVHGFVNTSGKFENLAVVFPNGLAEARFLLHALQQWQFRPAQQNGQATAVEVLLIIPNETD